MNEIYREWLRRLYQEVIKESEAAIANERLWANGAEGEAAEMHLRNAEDLEGYIKVLKGLMDAL